MANHTCLWRDGAERPEPQHRFAAEPASLGNQDRQRLARAGQMPPALLSGLGNQAVQRALGRRRLMRERLKPTQLLDLTVREFDVQRKEAQMDWANQMKSDAGRKAIWEIIDWGLDALATFTLRDVVKEAIKPGGVRSLKAYCNGLNGTLDGGLTTRLNPRATLLEMVRDGQWLDELTPLLGGERMRAVMPAAAFDNLVQDPAVAREFVAYYKRRNPILQAPNGKDTTAFVTLVKTEHANLEQYEAALVHVKNVHKFSGPSLEKLKTDLAPTKKPLTLILQTLYDHSGAFIRHARIAETIANTNTRAYAIEGPSLPDIHRLKDGGLDEIAAKHGVGGKITQVLVAGHGNAQTMDLGGSETQVGKNERSGQYEVSSVKPLPLTLDTEEYDRFWTSFFEALYKNMAAKGGLQPTVLLRACLTASNEVDVVALKREMAKDGRIDVSKVDPTKPENQVKIRAGIVEYIRRHGSLAKVLGDKAGERAKVVGAQASIDVDSVGSVNTATGQLELVPESDKMVGGTKFQYVRAGKEPLGVMRAVIEAWAVDQVRCFDEMNARLLDPVTTIDEVIIRTLYRTILNTYPNDILTANALTATASVLSGVAAGGSRCRPAHLRTDPMVQKHRGSWYKTLLANFDIAPEVVLLQDWMAIEPLAESVFVGTMSKPGITWSPVAPYLDFEILAPHLNVILGADTSSKRGRIIVALVGAIERDNALSTAYLRGQADENGKLPDEVKDELGTYSERQLRIKLGLPSDEAVTEPKTTKSATTVKPAHPRNIAQSFHVKPMAEIKTMNKSSLTDWAKVRAAPDDGAEELESQYRTKDYHIDGEVRTLTGGETGWYMVRTEQGRAGYLRKKYF